MSIKGKKFTDDGWAIWIDGDDTSTIYFHDWMPPKGKSYIDVFVKIVGSHREWAVNASPRTYMPRHERNARKSLPSL